MAFAVKFSFLRVFALFLLLGFSACSSQFSSNKATDAGIKPLTAEQKKTQLADLANHLEGDWICAGSADRMTACFAEVLTFTAALDHLTIQNKWQNCRMNTDYSLAVGVEDADGITDFSLHDNGPGTLAGPSDSDAMCKKYIASYSDNPLNENFSFTHNADWTQITINETFFTKRPIASPSVSPSPTSSPNQLSNS
jgi:hypothetical protein